MNCQTVWPANLLAATVAIILLGLPGGASALTEPQIDAVASQTTVVIGQELNKGEIEEGEKFLLGSGVIVCRQGKTYYVLTALHVVDKKNLLYGVRTSDGEVQVVDLDSEQGRGIDGFDLAVVKFKSSRDYPIASLGSSEQLEELDKGDTLYVSGWPDPEAEDKSPRRERITTKGLLTLKVADPQPGGGYSLLYSNYTRSGMSGGPVFNQDGQVVGIHGHGRGLTKEGVYCVDPQLSAKNSCGMQVIHFLSAKAVESLRLSFNRGPVDPQVIADGMVRKPQADVIPDIYQLFKDLKSRLRVCPSTPMLIDEPGC